MSTPEFMHWNPYFKADNLNLLRSFVLTLIGEDDLQ